MAQARLRKTFKYPDDGDLPADLDEQEQERLISDLKKKNEDTNLEFLKLFVGMTAIAAMLFVPIFFRTKLAKPKLIAIMGMSSLALSIYMLVMIPTKGKPLPAKDLAKRFKDPFELSPMQRWVPLLNGPAAALVFLLGLEFKDHPRVHDGFWLICGLPITMYIIIQFVRRFVVEVDLDALNEMRYEYKGA